MTRFIIYAAGIENPDNVMDPDDRGLYIVGTKAPDTFKKNNENILKELLFNNKKRMFKTLLTNLGAVNVGVCMGDILVEYYN